MSTRTQSPEARQARRCRSKRTYPTMAAAKNAAGRYLKHNGTVLDAYKCGCCGGYHLTSKE